MPKHAVLGAAALALAAVAAPFLATLAVAHDYTVGDLKVDHPFSRATPPGARVGAGYLKIENAGSQPDRLIAVACDCAEASEIHKMSMVDNVMRMRQLSDGLEIPAGGSAVLEPGGNHLMFIGLKHPFVEGESIEATLTFETAGPVTVSFTITPLRPTNGHGHQPSHGKPAH